MEGFFTNSQILEKYLKNGLIQTCVDCQFARLCRLDPWKMQYKEDFFQDLIAIILKYDNAKLNDVESKGWMNGWLTRVILNQLYSNSSEFYTTYLKPTSEKTHITIDEFKMKDDGDEEED